MEIKSNPLFCDEIFCVIKLDFEGFAAMLVSLSGAPRWPLHILFLKMSDTQHPITLGRNALALQNFRCAVFNSLQFHKHFGIEICF